MARREIVVKARRTTPPIYRLDHYRWRQLKRKHKQDSASRNLPCARCRYPIDYALPHRDSEGRVNKMAYETGHIQSRRDRPDLMYTWTNLQPEHVACNRSAGAKPVAAQGDWVQPSW